MGFQENCIYTLNLLFSLDIKKMVQNLYKNWLLVSKVTREIRTTSDKQWKVQKVQIRWEIWNSFLQLKHYIQRISLTLLSTTCVKVHQIPYVISETVSHFPRYYYSVFFSSSITHFQQKYLVLKFPKFLMSFFR